MLTKELHYELPSNLIAQSPCEQRDHSRLLVYNRASNQISHHHFHELPDLLPPNLAIFRNDVSVLKARIHGKRATGGSVECLLLRPGDQPETIWKCLLKPGGKTAKAKFLQPFLQATENDQGQKHHDEPTQHKLALMPFTGDVTGRPGQSPGQPNRAMWPTRAL